jgi:hypothetical protein
LLLGLAIGAWQGFDLGWARGREDERRRVRAFILGAHRTEERLDPKGLERRIREREHIGWTYKG